MGKNRKHWSSPQRRHLGGGTKRPVSTWEGEYLVVPRILRGSRPKFRTEKVNPRVTRRRLMNWRDPESNDETFHR